MKKSLFTVEHTRQLTADTYEMILSGDTSAITAPGQFVNLDLPGHFLRRPISICNWTDEALMLLVKVVGAGTHDLVRSVPGTELDVLTGLGNGFDPAKAGDAPVLVGGGVGVPPLYGLAKKLIEAGKKPFVILGFNKAEEIFYAEEFKALGADVVVTTVDGSVGVKGFVTNALPETISFVYTCGPLPMLKALYKATGDVSGEYSLEERMGCGFGACMGCSIMTKEGAKRVCKDGPIFQKEVLEWQI
ncbi:MAG: dihydroorotate dehydrogenase electron transfer subunit [Mailhella sp.]|nr:dihydroorotate dehydrogenase electron transfer subunit [Mailhella sp.]